MLRQISLAWRNVKNNRRTMGLLSLDNWRGVNLWRNKNELSTLGHELSGPLRRGEGGVKQLTAKFR